MKLRLAAIPLLLSICATAMVSAADQPGATMHSIRLYNTEAKLTARIGNDAGPMGDCIKALEKQTNEILAAHPKLGAKGLLVAVGIKPGKLARVWCQAVDGEIPQDTLDDLEKKLSDVPSIDVKDGPVAFAIEFNVGDQQPKEFPTIPKAWSDGLKGQSEGAMIPDGLFPIIWPDSAAATQPTASTTKPSK